MYENKRIGFLFVLPFVIGVLGFKLFPFVMSFALSFTQYDFISPPQYIGLENYQELATASRCPSLCCSSRWASHCGLVSRSSWRMC